MTFGEQLKFERQRLGITQPQAATILGVPDRTYWEWEAGKTTPYAITQEGALGRLRGRQGKGAKHKSQPR
jgi:transcriptional regulator with XRE-family HTH domain